MIELDAIKRVRAAVIRCDEGDLSARIVVLLSPDRVLVASRFSVSTTLSAAGRSEAAHLVRSTKVPLGSALIVSAPLGAPVVEVVQLWERL